MKIYILYIIALAFISINGYAQEANLYIYEGKFNNSFGRGDNTRQFEGRLIVQGQHSVFTMKEVGFHSAGLQDNTLNLRPDSMFTVFKDHDTQSLLFEFIDFNQRSHWYADTLFPVDWQLVNEEKMIGGIPCSKAVGYFKGREYIVWYAPSIAQAEGPWKLGGLSGLILEAYDAEDNWHMTWVSRQEINRGFDQSFYLRKINNDLQGYAGYAAHVKRMFSRLQASMAAQATAGCVGCQAVPKIKINTWETID